MLDVKEAVARQLYTQWCGDQSEPDWDRYEKGQDLNPIGLAASNFRETAEAIAPYDTAEAVARRRCLANGIPECFGIKGMPCCTEATCSSWKEWLPHAEQIVALAKKAG